jgi:Mrp family chromosome partitioning ATPase
MLAQQGYRTLVVDADFESKELTRTLAPQSIEQDGLVQLVEGTATPRQVIVPLDHDTEGLAILPTGLGEMPVDEPRSVTEALELLGDGFDVVVADLAGELSDPRTAMLARACGRLLTLVGHGDRMFEVERLREDLGLLGIACDGVVFTEARPPVVGSAV